MALAELGSCPREHSQDIADGGKGQRQKARSDEERLRGSEAQMQCSGQDPSQTSARALSPAPDPPAQHEQVVRRAQELFLQPEPLFVQLAQHSGELRYGLQVFSCYEKPWLGLPIIQQTGVRQGPQPEPSQGIRAGCASPPWFAVPGSSSCCPRACQHARG